MSTPNCSSSISVPSADPSADSSSPLSAPPSAFSPASSSASSSDSSSASSSSSSSTAPAPAPPSPQYVEAVLAAGEAFIAANPGHPLQFFADLPIQTHQRERGYLLNYKNELKERMGNLNLEKHVRGARERKAIKKEERVLLQDYKETCTMLGERPEVGHCLQPKGWVGWWDSGTGGRAERRQFDDIELHIMGQNWRESLFLMACTFALPYRAACHGPTKFHFDHEQYNITAYQESEYDADVEAVDVEDEEPRFKIDRSIATTTQAAASPVIAWQAFNTAQSGTAQVEVAQVDVAAQANIIGGGSWHAVRITQIEPVRSVHPQSNHWTPINVSSMRTSKINVKENITSGTEDTQSSVVRSNDWSVISGSQTDTSQATSIEPDQPSSSYPRMWNTSHLYPKKISKASTKTLADMPKLKDNFRKYKKEYTSASAKEKIKWFRHRIACIDTGNKEKFDSETAVLESEWVIFWERRRWLKREMLKIKNLYTFARLRRQERMKYDLRASYDIGFIKSVGEN
ncbi:hypothetical protein NHQ30_008775 [Ciborinia camelliae]|nr:hypothetical protein NHQ30_008775 [Ciborinia camelliae]